MNKHTTILLIVFSLLSYACNSQTRGPRNIPVVGGGCEGCELMYVGMPKNIPGESVSPGWHDQKPKLIVSGTIYKVDGKTPAPNVVVYYWHTDSNGLYSAAADTPLKAKEHGRLRGWVKTGPDGKYVIRTSRPAPYPKDIIPAHIHLSIKEPDIANEYFADLYFEDDSIYLEHHLKKYGKEDRAGSEVLSIRVVGNVQLADHNIILGMNIPNYPIDK